MKKLSIILCALALTACGHFPTAKAPQQRMTLERAIERGKADTVAQMLQAGVSPNARTAEDEPLSPLWLALHHGRGDMDIVQQLLAAGAALFFLWKKNGKKLPLVIAAISGVLGLFGLLEATGILTGVPVLAYGLPAVLSCYFDLFSGFVQAYVFTLLTMVYISGSLPEPAEAPAA